ncbi:MAG: UvrD-helicase domain-containing protein [Candidatus Methylomirabilales bacterium]
MMSNIEKELQEALERILKSSSRKKLVVAGPGTGKTHLFKTLLEPVPEDPQRRLVLTFINNLKLDLEQNLAGLASVFTLHGYCQSLLRRQSRLRMGLTRDFRCLPRMASIVKTDWEYIRGGEAPPFVDLMRNLENDDRTQFYLARGNYYNAVDFDDSVFRVHRALIETAGQVDEYDLVLIDEYQDFNRMEAALIDLLASTNPILIAGDDDQALYSQLRGASWEFIRRLHRAGEYEVFPLPFCLRSPQVIVDATNDIISAARQERRLKGRIEKPFRHYEPAKGKDSKRYPKISLVITSVQRPNANYFGRYIEEAIKKVPEEEVKEAVEKGYPVALIIGSNPYRKQVVDYLRKQGWQVDTGRDRQVKLSRADGLEILKGAPESNLGWRVLLEVDRPSFAATSIRATAASGEALIAKILEDYRTKVLEEARAYEPEGDSGARESKQEAGATVKATTYEGAKGLSAQHVFIIGVHEGEFPRDSKNVQDLEICRFIVGLTRTRKKCTLVYTKYFGDKLKRPSVFLSWIRPGRYQVTKVDATYWKKER